MKILIDARPLQTYSRFRGIGRYVKLLIEVFGDNTNFYFFFFKGEKTGLKIKNKIIINSPKRGITFTDNLFLPKILKKNNIDIYHSTAYALPRKTKNVKYILTFHDITPLKYPEYSSTKNLFLYKKIVRSSKRADKLIAVSQRSKKDLISFTALSENKINVIYHALNRTQMLNDDMRNKIQNKLPKEYIFYVGGFDGNKNVTTIMKTINILELPIVISGAISENKKNELLSIVDEEKRSKIVFTGYVSDEDLQILYRNAKIFVFPSLYEGFGFPPLEALMNGTSSVVSKCGAIPEVLEDAAFYIENPLDYKVLAEKISLLWNDSKLRTDIVKRGEKVLERYSFDRFESQMRTLYSNWQ